MSPQPLTAYFELTPLRLRHTEPEPEPELHPSCPVTAEQLRHILHPEGRERPLRHLNILHPKATGKRKPQKPAPWLHYPVGHTLTLTRYGKPVAEATITATRIMKLSTRIYICAPLPTP